jgi:hypothetical protein
VGTTRQDGTCQQEGCKQESDICKRHASMMASSLLVGAAEEGEAPQMLCTASSLAGEAVYRASLGAAGNWFWWKVH